MKAVIFDKYGTPDDLHLGEWDKPVPGETDVLIRMHAASINDWDWGLLRGLPFVNRMMFGLRKPKIRTLGSDVAGTVEAVGAKVSRFKAGDEVFGDLSGVGIHGWGGFAEYHCAPEDALIIKPPNMTFAQAAAIPQAAVLAWQGLLKGEVKPGMQVLINGAAGGTGSFAVQMAKHLGAEVTGTARTSKLDFLRQLGCDHVIDFTQENFTRNGRQYDFILDLMVHFSIFDYRRALKPKGRFIMVGGVSSRIIQIMLLSRVLSLFGKKQYGILMHKANKDMDDIIDLFKSGSVTPVIDKCFPLEDSAEAFRYFGEGRKKGKVVILIDH